MPGTTARRNILLVEDNPGDAKLVEHHLNAPHVATLVGDVDIQHEDSLTDALDALEDSSHDVMFLDLGLPESRGLETLERVLDEAPWIPIIVLTGLNDRETAVSAIKRGAQDYLLKDDLDADLLARTLRYAIERHEKELELRHQNNRLEKFANVVSHDLRNPLNVASGRLALAQEEIDNEHLGAMEQALTRMEALIQDLLTLARQGQTLDSVEPVDLETVTDASWEQIETRQASLVVDTTHRILADEGRLQQLLENLLRNAIDHGGDAVTVTVTDLDDGFAIEDDGPGIPPADRDTIFESGYSTAEDGTGFGLMIVETICTAHDWTVICTDAETGGARFEITGVDILKD